MVTIHQCKLGKAYSVTPSDVFLILIRLLHALAAVIWLGGSIFYVIILRNRGRSEAGNKGTHLDPEAVSRFRSLVDTCIGVLIITGVILLFDSIASPSTPPAYLITLGVKIVLVLCMFVIARGRWRQRNSAEIHYMSSKGTKRNPVYRAINLVSGVNLIVILGILVFFLSDLLAFIYQEGLTGK